MDTLPVDENLALMVDGNALAGLLNEIFGVEMTAAPLECASCGREGELGSLWAFVENPGYVLRCPACHQIVLRMVATPNTLFLDARGAAYLSIAR